MACKTAHKLDTDEFWQYVRTVGSGEIDQPGGTWPNLYMKWTPIWKQSCRKCAGDESTGGQPYCVYNCPTKALVYGDASDPEGPLAKRAAELRGQGFRIYEIPAWEDTREGVMYAENGI